MTVRQERRGGEPRWIIDISYKTADGRRRRFRHDAQVQTKTAAQQEERRLLGELGRSGELKACVEPIEKRTAPADVFTFADAVRHFRATRMASSLKPSTRYSYGKLLDTLLTPRFGTRKLAELGGTDLSLLDAELADDGLKPSTRRNVHVVFRSVLRTAVDGGLLAALPPRLPRLPKVGRMVVKTMQREDLQALFAVASPTSRLAFGIAAYAGLRASEVRGLRWSDIEFGTNTLVVRRGICHGEESSPKSHHQRIVPLAAPLRALLEAVKGRKKKSPWSPVSLTMYGKPWSDTGLNQAFERTQARANLSGWSFHSLRHFFVTELFRRGASAPVVQQLAGHADLTTTQRYADMGAGDLRAAIALFGSEPPSGAAE